ncbi:aldehyde dehydrogenase (NAD+) [Saliterribacillus persicus]|uniref:Aldehyde dehydrogenase n=2 Tax=Saliterribacillus persicus TaxID=930114 RepID=A0A368XYW0_9BACI|nr:aldehyde dehydrogenase (NAD+) [Saliterribacillus persicus]
MLALQKDLNKSAFEAYSTEIGILYEEIAFIRKNLKKWSQPKRVKTPLTHTGSKSYIYAQPYGVALIIAPWNYPVQLALSPLIGAIAAGNCVILKPSEMTPHTANILEKIINAVFDEAYIRVVQGDKDVSQALLDQHFDYIFFTGSVPVGKIIMEKAAEKLTPITLELGGKSPAIVHEDANLNLAAKRIAWGKFINAGQTCVAPDYIYVHQSVADVFLEKLKAAIVELYAEDPLKNTDYTHIVNQKSFDRLIHFTSDGTTYFGGESDEKNLILAPTILTDISWKDNVMNEEIFGPILPTLTYDRLEEVREGIKQSPNPLAFYFFSEDKSLSTKMIEEVSFGGGCINDTIFHLASPYLPFGGVGNSGIGHYHGKYSFDTFTHYKSILKQTTKFDVPLRYPSHKNLKFLKKLWK